MSLGMMHSADEEDMVQSSSPRQSIIDKRFQRTRVSFYPAGISYRAIFISPLPHKVSSPSWNPRFLRSSHLLNNLKHLPYMRQSPYPMTNSLKCLTTAKHMLRDNGLPVEEWTSEISNLPGCGISGASWLSGMPSWYFQRLSIGNR